MRPGDHDARLDRAGDDQQVQSQARALGEPTRYRIFRYVVDADAPVGIAAISDHVGLNQSSVRQHLAKLCAAGLLREEVARSAGPGRPGLRYRPAAAALARWTTPPPYQGLAMRLLELLAGGATPAEVGVAAGRQAVAAAPAGADAVDRLEEAMARQGFESRREEAGGSVDLVVGRCPFEDAAVLNAEIVCELHRGVTEGMVQALDGELVHLGTVVRDPRDAGCRVQLRRGAAAGQ